METLTQGVSVTRPHGQDVQTAAHCGRHQFNTSSEKRPYVTIKIAGPNGQFIPVRMLYDTGNDIFLINEETGRRLGIPADAGTPFSVMGVSAGLIRPRLVRLMVQMGCLKPRLFRVGVGAVPENLMGFQDTSMFYRVIFDGSHTITVEEKGMKPSNLSRRVFSSQAARYLGNL
jgi:hypothetical protein